MEAGRWDHVAGVLPWTDREWYRAGIRYGASYGRAATESLTGPFLPPMAPISVDIFSSGGRLWLCIRYRAGVRYGASYGCAASESFTGPLQATLHAQVPLEPRYPHVREVSLSQVTTEKRFDNGSNSRNF